MAGPERAEPRPRHGCETGAVHRSATDHRAGCLMLRLALLALALSTATAGATPAVPASAMPDDVLGTWGRDEAACTDPASDGRMKVERRSVQMFDATCTFDRIRIIADGIFEGRGPCVTARGGRRYRGGVSLMGLGDRMMVRFPDRRESPTYHRCAQALPVR